MVNHVLERGSEMRASHVLKVDWTVRVDRDGPEP
jgi:hypothetical protein